MPCIGALQCCSCIQIIPPWTQASSYGNIPIFGDNGVPLPIGFIPPSGLVGGVPPDSFPAADAEIDVTYRPEFLVKTAAPAPQKLFQPVLGAAIDRIGFPQALRFDDDIRGHRRNPALYA